VSSTSRAHDHRVPNARVRGDGQTRPLADRVGAISVIASICVVTALYLLFVIHYSVNALNLDDWTVIPLIHAELHGHLSLSALWAQHNENRMLVPNLIVIVLGVATHDDTRVTVLLSATIFVATFLLFLKLFRSYLDRPLSPLPVLVLGAVWFSVADLENALWAFQLAWYLILLLLFVVLYLLLIRRSRIAFSLALVASVAASYSSVQGLELWPVGLVCILWPMAPRLWLRSRRMFIWLGSGVATTTLYFWGYQADAISSDSERFVLHHPVKVAEFVLIEIGEVIPNSKSLWLSGILGTVLLAAAVFLVVQSIRHRERNCLPVALVTFGILFDLSTAFGRAGFGKGFGPTTSRYTMANLLVLTAIVAFAWIRLERQRSLAIAGIALVAIQFASATNSGFSAARVIDQNVTFDARVAVNLDLAPDGEKACYAELVYPTFGYSVQYVGIAEAQADHLGDFASGPLQIYRAWGLPTVLACRKET
jgi:hypothetical protein